MIRAMGRAQTAKAIMLNQPRVMEEAGGKLKLPL